jgi:hypothetical protein
MQYGIPSKKRSSEGSTNGPVHTLESVGWINSHHVSPFLRSVLLQIGVDSSTIPNGERMLIQPRRCYYWLELSERSL